MIHSFQTGRFLGAEGHDVHETGLMHLAPTSDSENGNEPVATTLLVNEGNQNAAR
jgi:hypothetical protein